MRKEFDIDNGTPLWSDQDELEYQVSFDMPLFRKGYDGTTKQPTIPPHPVEKPFDVPAQGKSEQEKLHIRRDGK
jgi:hypothetical protein